MTGSRPSTDEYFLRMAELVATRSTCLRRSVGCVLVDTNNHVLSTGYNGVARGRPHCNEATHIEDVMRAVPGTSEERVIGQLAYGYACPGHRAPSGTALNLCEAVHAEANALVQCRDISAIHTLYCTASPCVQCMRMILGTSVKRIVFRQEYPHAQSKELAVAADIVWECLEGL